MYVCMYMFCVSCNSKHGFFCFGVCMYVWMYVCILLHTFRPVAKMHMCFSVCMYVIVYTDTYTYICIYIHMHTHIRIILTARIQTCCQIAHVFLYVHVCTCDIHAYHACMYMCNIHAYVCILLHTFRPVAKSHMCVP